MHCAMMMSYLAVDSFGLSDNGSLGKKMASNMSNLV